MVLIDVVFDIFGFFWFTAARRVFRNLYQELLLAGPFCDTSRGIRRLSNLSNESLQAITLRATSRRILRLQNFSSESVQAIAVCDTSQRKRLRMTEMRRTAARRILINLVKDSLHTGALCDTAPGIRQ